MNFWIPNKNYQKCINMYDYILHIVLCVHWLYTKLMHLFKCITHVFIFYAANTVNYNFWKCFFWKAGDYQMVLQLVMVLFHNIPLLMKINTSNRYRIINVKVLVLSTSNSLWKYTFTLNDFLYLFFLFNIFINKWKFLVS